MSYRLKRLRVDLTCAVVDHAKLIERCKTAGQPIAAAELEKARAHYQRAMKALLGGE